VPLNLQGGLGSAAHLIFFAGDGEKEEDAYVLETGRW
jgi:hypothetical protein